jgi:Na+-driven multidrug efflux pump
MVFRKNWAYIFNDDIEVVQLVGRIMPLVALFQACIIFASPLDAADLTASDI